MNDPYRLMYDGTSLIRDSSDWDESKLVARESGVCSDCRRQLSDTERPGVAKPYQYVSGERFAWEYQCVTCATLRRPAPVSLGVQRSAGKGGGVKNFSLSMFLASGAVIVPDGTMYLAAQRNPKSDSEPHLIQRDPWNKTKDQLYGQRNQVYPGNALDLLFHLDAEGEIPNIREGIVVIERFGDRVHQLMPSLRMTTSWSEVILNSDQGPKTLEVKTLWHMAKILEELGLLEKAQKPGFWRFLSPHLWNDTVETWVKKHGIEREQAKSILQCIPNNPSIRFDMANQLKSIVWLRSFYEY